MLKTGDIILFKGNGLFSTLIMAPLEANYSHVGIYVRHDGKPCVFESTSLGCLPDIITGEKINGVQLTPFDERVELYDGEVFHRPIIGVRTLTQHTALRNFIVEHHGKPYERSNWELANAEIDGIFPWHENKPDASSLFCSETTCMALRAMNIMQITDEPANEYTPTNFAEDFKLCEGYNFGSIKAL